MLEFGDTNIFMAYLLPTEPFHEEVSNLLDEVDIGFTEAVARELRRTFATKYNLALKGILKIIDGIRRKGLNDEDEILDFSSAKLKDLISQNPNIKQFYEYLFEISSEYLVNPERHPDLVNYLDDHLISILSKIHGLGEKRIVKIDDEKLDSRKKIYSLVGNLFRQVTDAEVFCQVVSTLIEYNETGKLYTLDKDFSKESKAAIEVLKKNGYNIQLEVIYLPDRWRCSGDSP